MAVFLSISPMAVAWQLALGGGLTGGVLAEPSGTTNAAGWQFLAQWTRRPRVARRVLIDLSVGQWASVGSGGGFLERSRVVSALLFFEGRLPLTYALRPWWGLGGGLTEARYDLRMRLNGQGYAVGYAPSVTHNDWTVAGTVSLPLDRSWSLALTAATNGPSRFSTVTLTLVWRLL